MKKPTVENSVKKEVHVDSHDLSRADLLSARNSHLKKTRKLMKSKFYKPEFYNTL